MSDDDKQRAGLEGEARALEGELLLEGEGPAFGSGAAPGADGVEDEGFDVDPFEIGADTLEMLLEGIAPYWLDPELPESVRITRPKIDKLSKSYVRLVMKYLPGILEKFPLEVACLVQTALIIKPLVRAGVPLRKPKPVDAEVSTG